MVNVQKLENTDICVLGEGPHWDSTTQNLYLVDISGKAILKYSPRTKKLTKATVDKIPTSIIPVQGRKNQFIASLDKELVILSWDGENDKISIVEKLASVDQSFNDAKCDSTGRLWIGTHKIGTELAKTEPLGVLYSFDTKRKLEGKVDKIRIANGLAFNDNTKKMYYIDSLAGTVDQFDLDINTATLSNRCVWFSLSKFNIPGIPDGMTIDTDGNLWVAVFGGSRILKISGSESETLLDSIDIPAEQVTSVAFGGQNLDELYVTTGNFSMEGKKPATTANGATFKVTGTGAKGYPGVAFKLN